EAAGKEPLRGGIGGGWVGTHKGFRLNEQLYQMIVRRYSDENSHMDFDNFISCLVRLDAMFRAFKSLDKDGDGQIRVNIQEVSEAGGWPPPPAFSFLLSSKGP
uniref:Calpain small subunit 1 n=1 Tax=Gopherus agassizii TaxID=38772 RepID=A0A452IG44_9SAUR